MYWFSWANNFTDSVISASTAFANVAFAQVLRNVPLMEAMILLDGVVNASVFAREYMLYKLSAYRLDPLQRKYKKAIVDQCRRVYKLDVLDRYMLYLGTYLVYLGITPWDTGTTLYTLMCSLALPFIQNSIVNVRIIARFFASFNMHKRRFAKYSLSKLVVRSIASLDADIKEISNYNIFILYHFISTNMVYSFLKTYAFIYTLNWLRSDTSTYYYYKAIKFAYFYNTGYMFNVMTRKDAVFIINKITKDKRWNELGKIEVANALFTLISAEFTKDIAFQCLKLLSTWSMLCVLKLLSVYLNTILLGVYMWNVEKLHWTTWCSDNSTEKLAKYAIGIVVYALVMLHANDLLIALVVFGHRFMFVIFEELVFYIQNYKSIGKVLEYYYNVRPSVNS